jgi:uncharacterized membrane protein YhdT
MMTLIALAIGVAFVFSVAVTFGYPGMPLWEELATLVTVMLLGHWLEMSSVSQAQGALWVRRIYAEGRCAIGKLHPAFIGVKNVPPWLIMKCDGDGESRPFIAGARMA